MGGETMRMLRKYMYMALMMQAAADSYIQSGKNPYYIPDTPTIKPMSDEEKARIHAAYKRQFHTFIINGVEISAKSKKDAKKIYSKMKGARQ